MRIDDLLSSVVTVAAAVVLSVAVVRYVPAFAPKSADFVVLDVVKLNNAFRRTAAPLLQGAQENSAEVAEFTLSSRRALEVVDEVADGRPVMLRHAFVGQAAFEDITDEIISRLGLEPGTGAVDSQQLEQSLATGAPSASTPATSNTRSNAWAKKLVP